MPPMLTDAELLRRYAEGGDEAAFGELVRRRMDFVYSVAWRVTANGALAQDVAQSVFTQLARSAAALGHYDTLAGWLHTTARHCAINAVRGEERRRAREQESATMATNATTPEINWVQISPLLDEAVGGLREDDRQAVLLRFFQGSSHQEIGVALGLSEDTARKRVERALEKLRGHFARRGVTATSALLAAAISENSVQAAPAGLAASVTGASLAGKEAGSGVGAGVAAEGILLKILLMSTKNKILVVGAIILMVAATWMFYLWSPKETLAAAKAKGGVAAPASPSVAPKIVAARIASPSPIPSAVSAAVTEPVAASPPDPHGEAITELNSTLDTIASFYRVGDLAGAYLAMIRPDKTNLDYAQKLQEGEQKYMAEIANDPEDLRKEQASNEGMAKEWEDFESQTPTFNSTGDEATYPFEDVNGNTPMTLIKINGKWYRKDDVKENGMRP